MENNSQNANINVTVDARDAQQAVKQLGDEVQKLSAVMGKLTQQQQSLSSFSSSVEAVAKQLQALNLISAKANQQMYNAAGSYDAAKKRLKDLDEQIKSAAGGINSMSPAVKRMVGEYNKLEAQVRTLDEQLGNSGKAFDDFKSNIDSLIDTIPEFAEGFGEGLKAVGEQLPDLIEGYRSFRAENAALAAQGQPTKSLLTQLAGSFGSWNFAITAGMALLTAYGPKVWDFVTNLFKGKEAVDDTKESTELLNKALESTDYTNAVENVNRLTIDIDLARKGILDKEEVLKQYNDTIGKVTGRVNDLNKAEKSLTENGEPYIQMMLHKATASLALQEAAKKAYQAEQAKLKSDEEVLGGVEGYFLSGTKGSRTDLYHATAERYRKEEADKLLKEANKYLGIARVQETKAGEDHKKMHPEGKPEKPEKPEKTGTGNKSDDHPSNLQGDKTLNQQQANEKKQAAAEAEAILKSSQAQELLITSDGYAQQLMAAENHFQEELKKLKDLHAKKLIDKAIYEKAAFQLVNERQATTQNAIDAFNKENAEKTLRLSNELENLKIANIADNHEREIAESKQQEKEKLEDLSRRHKEEFDKQTKLEGDLARLKANAANYKTAADKVQYDKELAALQESVDKQKQIVQIHLDAKKEIETKFRTDREKSQKAYEEGNKAKAGNTELGKLNADVTEKGKKAKPFLGDKDLLAAQEKALNKKYELEIAAAEKAGQSIYTLKLQHEADVHKLHEDFAKKREELAIGSAKKVAEKGFSILKNSIRVASEARLKSLDEDKSRELANTSLTSAQKKAVEEKYKKKQLEEKVKAFRAEQKASLAQALINGALAMTKVASQTGVLSFAFSPLIAAQTAVAVATILRQKPPAYALGGVHGRRYASDGRGGVLPGYSRYDNVNAFLRDGEGIVVSEAMRNPYARQMVSDINQSFGGRAFAAGGVFSNSQYLPTTSNPARMQPVINANIDYGKLAAAMASMPPPIMDIKDVNTQQQRLAQSESRANL